MILEPVVGLLALASVVNGHVPRLHAKHAHQINRSSSLVSSPLLKRDSDPSNMEWIKRWAAIGDSYTAGIGAGRPMGHQISADEVAIRVPDGIEEIRDNYKCSRYDMAYPKVIEAQFGSHIEKDGGFQYIACSGDRSEQIYQQAQALKGELDFVTFTSGGNDLCLAGIIADCIMLPYFKNSACETVIAKAQENVKSIIKDNIRHILEALDEKMNDDGIVVVNGYAQFFDTTSNNCDKQSWDAFWFLPLGASYQALSIARRHTFNQLVLDINSAIRDAVDEAAESDKVSYKVGYAEWDRWVSNEVDARMCSPSSNGDYPDKNQPDMHFIKPDTHPWFNWGDDVGRDELRKRDTDLEDLLSSPRLSSSEKRQVKRLKSIMEARDKNLERDLYDSILYKSSNPNAAVKHKLNPRAPSPPGCPGDGTPSMTFGLGMPDHIGRNVSKFLDDARGGCGPEAHARSFTPTKLGISPLPPLPSPNLWIYVPSYLALHRPLARSKMSSLVSQALAVSTMLVATRPTRTTKNSATRSRISTLKTPSTGVIPRDISKAHQRSTSTSSL